MLTPARRGFVAFIAAGLTMSASGQTTDSEGAAPPVPLDSWTFRNDAPETFFSHLQRVSDDGRFMVATGRVLDSEQTSVFLMSSTSPTPVWSYLPAQGVESLAISADGSTVVLGTDKVVVFGNTSAEPRFTLDPNDDDGDGVGADDFYNALAVTPDGRFIAAGSDINRIAVIDATSRKVVSSFSYERASTMKTISHVASLAISDDGRYVAVGGNYVYLYDRERDEILWCHEMPGSLFGDNDATSITISADGGRVAASNRDHVYVFHRDSGTPVWSEKFIERLAEQSNATSAMSDDGAFVAVAYRDPEIEGHPDEESMVRIHGGSDGTVVSSARLIGDAGKVSVSADGKYVAVRADFFDAQVSVFDRAYGTQNRPFHVYAMDDTGLMDDDDMELSGHGGTLFFQGDGLQYRQVKPGILVDPRDALPVYSAGMKIKLRTFVTNPARARRLRLEVRAYLPQFAFWEGLEDELAESPSSRRGESIARGVSSVLGGGRTIFETTFDVGPSAHDDQVRSIRMPALENPAWLDELLGGQTILGTLGGPLFDLAYEVVDMAFPEEVAGDLAEHIDEVESANSEATGFYPMVGAATATVKDPETGEVYGRDGFTFIYLAQY